MGWRVLRTSVWKKTTEPVHCHRPAKHESVQVFNREQTEPATGQKTPPLTKTPLGCDTSGHETQQFTQPTLTNLAVHEINSVWLTGYFNKLTRLA